MNTRNKCQCSKTVQWSFANKTKERKLEKSKNWAKQVKLKTIKNVKNENLIKIVKNRYVQKNGKYVFADFLPQDPRSKI